MNLKKIIKESLKGGWEWVEESNPTLKDYLDAGLIQKGDTLWLKGYTKINDWDSLSSRVYIDGWFQITKVGLTIGDIEFTTNEDIVEKLNLTNNTGNFLECDGNLEVYKVEKESLTESIESEEDPFDWIRKSNPSVPITELGPNDMYRIVHISGQALEDYEEDSDLLDYDPYSTLFVMDEESCFNDFSNGTSSSDYANENTTDVWIRPFHPEDTMAGGWVNIDKIKVNKVTEDTLTETKKKGSDFDWIIESDPYIRLEPNTLYYFEPNIGGNELVEFVNRFAAGYRRLGNYLRGLSDTTIKYFVTDEEGKNIVGWCHSLPLEDALEFYEGGSINVINARDYFVI